MLVKKILDDSIPNACLPGIALIIKMSHVLILHRSSDGLNSRVQKVLDARKASADTAADHAAVANRPSPVDSALQAAGKLQSSGSSTTPASNSTNTNNSDPLEHAVQLLAGMRSASLEQLEAVSGKAKKLAVYRWA